MTATTLFTLLVGVAIATGDQSALAMEEDQPIGAPLDHVGASRVDAPQVVLQLKYDKGELNKIYLAQFRNVDPSREPSVPARTSLCVDLCHAGLGGAACGASCSDMLPVGLQSALQSPVEDTAVYGEPRVAVCPTLCDYQLGEPLCNCSSLGAPAQASVVDWSAVCDAFCLTDHYTLGGCSICEPSATTPARVSPAGVVSRMLNTVDGWTAWCSVQCQQGHGGAACNCNRSPLQ